MTTKQIEKRAENPVRHMLESADFQAAMAAILPRHMTAERMARIAIAAMSKAPKLRFCSPQSIASAMMTLSQLGLEPDGRRAHLIPFENRKAGTVDCQLIIDYKGLVSLLMATGLVASIHADVVCDSDGFEVDMGEIVAHRIDYAKPRGNIYAVYCVIALKDGAKKTEIMTREDVEAVRARSRAANRGPWVTDWSEMAKKTVFRRAAKWLPLEAPNNDVAQRFDAALDVDDAQYIRETAKALSPGQSPLAALTAAMTEAPQEPAQGPYVDEDGCVIDEVAMDASEAPGGDDDVPF